MVSWRIPVLVFASLLGTGGVTVRLFSVAVLQHDTYVAQASERQQAIRDILPRRGQISIQDAAAGRQVIVAQSVERYAVTADPSNVNRKAEYARVLAAATGVNEQELFAKLSAGGKYMNPIAHNLSKEQVEGIAEQLNAVEKAAEPKAREIRINFDATQGGTIYFRGGVMFIREFERVYPEGGLLGQALGFVNRDKRGQYGFEEKYNQQLEGYSGRLFLERDSAGNLLGTTGQVAGSDGLSYELTVDRNIQFFVEQALKEEVERSEAEGGTVIVMDPKNGEIAAMASYPTYDPSKYREVTKEQVGLFDNPAISRLWEPGSIFKPLVMAAALDKGLVKPETTETFGESVTVDGHQIHTALKKAYGKQTMTEVLANSDNVAMVWVADKLGNEAMYDYLKKFGFGERSGIDLENEVAGNVLDVKKWRNINRATMSFGQGIATTPIQVIDAYGAVANGGVRVQPHFVKATVDPSTGERREERPAPGARVLQEDISKQLLEMMVATVDDAHKRAGTPGYKIAGKTGTAQVPDSEKGGYLENVYNHSFVGIGPAEAPRYVMLTKVDRPNLEKVGQFAEGTAVPLFGRISTFLLHYYQIQPTTNR